MLLETENEELILEIKTLFENHLNDFWDDLPSEIKNGI